jgi:hypothetical protein
MGCGKVARRHPLRPDKSVLHMLDDELSALIEFVERDDLWRTDVPAIELERADSDGGRRRTEGGGTPMPLKRQQTANGKCQATTKAGRQCAAPAVRSPHWAGR